MGAPDQTRVAVTWRAAGNCLPLFTSGTIETSIFPNRVIDKQSIYSLESSPRSLETREGNNGFVPVSSSTFLSALQRADGVSTTGAIVCHKNPPSEPQCSTFSQVAGMSLQSQSSTSIGLYAAHRLIASIAALASKLRQTTKVILHVYQRPISIRRG